MAFRVLSIDGGGMRGIYTASFLLALEGAAIKKRQCSGRLDIGKVFKLIVGTSTGAIIGCGLAKGVPTDKMVTLYQQYGAAIFPRKMPSSFNLDLITQLIKRPSYLNQGNKALEDSLKGVFGDMTVGQIWKERQIALAVPAVNLSNYRSWVFKTPHNPASNHRDDEYSLVEVCLASSAAPLFRSLAAIDSKTDKSYNVFCDGGLWANNPVIVALTEVLMMCPSDEEIEIFCLGSCGRPEGEIIKKEAVHRGIIQWKFGGDAAKVSISAQEFAFDNIAQMIAPYLTRKVRIVRFPAEKIPASLLQYLDLDETRNEGLQAMMQQARHDADMANSEMQHRTTNGQLIEALFNDMPTRAD